VANSCSLEDQAKKIKDYRFFKCGTELPSQFVLFYQGDGGGGVIPQPFSVYHLESH